ncbi:ABC transporter B family member 11 [Camellia lanceoleosa]|uniref:ABC transporter B family member 11 n=1 Tax=Camellia lanceoleosa TaxID=1840588 RepID=A0ACC0I0V2_9ERIC|nr:ABC transporter B family member 11 [Camellia lanceoleosa]
MGKMYLWHLVDTLSMECPRLEKSSWWGFNSSTFNSPLCTTSKQNAATAIVGLVIAFQANWLLALIILVMVPLIGLNGYIQAKFLSGFNADAKKSYDDASLVTGDAVGSIRTIASFSAEEKVMQLYQMKCEGPMKAGIRKGLVCGIGLGFGMFSLFLVYVFFGLTMTTLSISQSAALTLDLSRAKSAAISVLAILEHKSKTDSSDDSGTTLENVWEKTWSFSMSVSSSH